MNKKWNIVLWSIAFVLVIFAAYTVYDKYGTPPSNKIPGTQEAAGREMAPDFSLKDLDGNTVNLSDYRGKIVFLNFWATWCGPCQNEMPEFEEASQEFAKGTDAVILAINITDGVRDTTAKVKSFISERNFTLPVLLDQGGAVSNRYRIETIPTTYVINKDGTIYTVIGPSTRQDLENIVNSIK